MKPLRKLFPESGRHTGRHAAMSVGRATASLRQSPSFLLVGGQRCGTTSLFRALLAHPHVLRPVMHKGVNYFDVGYDSGWSWYLSHFPLKVNAKRHAPPGGTAAAVFEASGYYMFHPHAPRRIAEDLPAVKIVAMVRDPVERAYSAYKHEFARGFETLSFEEALAAEDERLEPELAKMIADPSYQSNIHRHQAYHRRGHYAAQLQQFVDLLGAERVHIVESERFFSDPEREYQSLLRFLELPALIPKSFDQFNARPGAGIAPQVRVELREHFDPHDQKLADLLGRPPVWRA